MKNNNKRIDELAKKVKKGDKKSFEELYKLTSSRAYFTALEICGDKQEAEDILQESYITALSKISTLERTESFMGWFNRIVANKSKDFLRKKNPDVLSENSEWLLEGQIDETVKFNPEENVDEEELKAVVMDAVKKLNIEKRTCVMMKYFNDMSVNEIAQAMEVPVSTVKNRLFDARKELKGLFEKKGITAAYSVAPFGVIGWAYNAVFENVAQSFEGSATAAKILSGIAVAGTASAAAGSAAAGSAAATGVFAKSAAATTMQKIVSGIAVAGVVTGSAVGISSAVKNNKDIENIIPTTSYTETVECSLQNSVVNIVQPASEDKEKEHDEKVIDYNIPGNMPHEVTYKGTMQYGKNRIGFEDGTDLYYADFEAEESGYYLFECDCVDRRDNCCVVIPEDPQSETISAFTYDEVNLRNAIQIYYLEKGINTVLITKNSDSDSTDIDVGYLGKEISDIIIEQDDLDNIVLGYNEHIDGQTVISQDQSITGEGNYANLFRTKIVFSSGKTYDMGDVELLYTVREGALKEGKNTAVFSIFGKEFEREITVRKITDYVSAIEIDKLEEFTFAKINEDGFVYEAPESYQITVTCADGNKKTFDGTSWDGILEFDNGVKLRIDMLATGLRDRQPLRFAVAIGNEIYIDCICIINEFDIIGYRKALDKNNLETVREYGKIIGEFYERAESSGDTLVERLGYTADAVKTSTYYSLKLVRRIAGFELDYAITTYKILTENEFIR